MKDKTNRNKGPSVTAAVLIVLMLLISSLCCFAAHWYIVVYGDLGFESILMTVSALEGVESGLITKFVLAAVVPALAATGIAGFFLLWRPNRNWKFYPLKRATALVLAVVISGGMMLRAADDSGFPTYVLNRLHDSTFIKKEYVDPDDVEIVFPEENGI